MWSISMGCMCLYACRNQSKSWRLSTRVWNLTERPIDLQIRVGSLLKKAHTLKPGSSKRLKCKNIYKAYMTGFGGGGGRGGNNNFYYDETYQPYVWVHDSIRDFSRMVKQQYISLDDLRDCSEIKIYRDYDKDCILVHKKPRLDVC
ncbi:RING zinc finger protein [Tasmannia lanceolata]|uniref:RING zinc finger protein n=1 Tax=Tasmannia lanceolata TaxID=3420 RepID=UPI004062EB26